MTCQLCENHFCRFAFCWFSLEILHFLGHASISYSCKKISFFENRRINILKQKSSKQVCFFLVCKTTRIGYRFVISTDWVLGVKSPLVRSWFWGSRSILTRGLWAPLFSLWDPCLPHLVLSELGLSLGWAWVKFARSGWDLGVALGVSGRLWEGFEEALRKLWGALERVWEALGRLQRGFGSFHDALGGFGKALRGFGKASERPFEPTESTDRPTISQLLPKFPQKLPIVRPTGGKY